MRDILLVIDMQNDFIDGALGTAEAVSIVENVAAKVKNFAGTVIFTRDTHEEAYMETQEGRNLPVPHLICPSRIWQIKSGSPVRPSMPSKKATIIRLLNCVLRSVRHLAKHWTNCSGNK